MTVCLAKSYAFKSLWEEPYAKTIWQNLAKFKLLVCTFWIFSVHWNFKKFPQNFLFFHFVQAYSWPLYPYSALPEAWNNPTLKAGLHLRALQTLFFEQSFHAIGQKKNEAILLARSDVMSARLEKKLKYTQLFFPSVHMT